VNQFVGLQVEHFDSRIFLGSQEQAVAREVDGKVVKSPSWRAGNWNRLQEYKRCFACPQAPIADAINTVTKSLYPQLYTLALQQG